MFFEPAFLLLTASCWIALVLARRRFRPYVLIVSGVAFYLLYAPRAAWLVAAVVVLTYVLDSRLGKWITIAGLVGLLVYFKRPTGMAFTGRDVNGLLAGGPLVPLGFSFLVLELIHFAMERSGGRIRDGSFANLAAFVFFFPCRVAGPIKRYNGFVASVAQAEPSVDDVSRGSLRILSGLFKKFALADVLTRAAASRGPATAPLEAWIMVLMYSLKLYFDFSAYSDIAIGLSRLMGIRVPENFRWPYLSPNIYEFWNRWHMSLSSWARDYVFMGVGRGLFKTNLKRRPGVIAAISYMATFLVVGLWHGLSLNFLVWGAYHGALVTSFHFFKMWVPVRVAKSSFYQSRLVSWGGTAFTFVLVTIGWVPFSMELPDALRVLRLMFTI